MKINFAKSTAFCTSKGSVSVLILTEEQAKKSNLKPAKFAKENFEFLGKINQAHLFSQDEKAVAVIGAGPEKKLDDLTLQKIGAGIVTFLNAAKIKNAKIFFESENSVHNSVNIAFGATLRGYRFNKYFENKKQDKELKIESLSFMVSDLIKSQKEFTGLQTLAQNIFFTRDLVSEPSNILNPESYAAICKSLKKDGLEVEILGEEAMKKLKMNSLLGVGKGSDKESQLVVLKWNGKKNSKEPPLAFVGKGVTFDSGGISIKPAANMEDMKTDMAGSAVVVGLLRNLAQRKAQINAVGVIGLVENMPSGTAQKPGDVVRSMSGQTIEVINTDAEGRLVLADALHYANIKFKPKFIVDLATLTGAIVVALADVHAGLFCNDDDLAKKIESCGIKTGESVWRLPLGKEYDEMINSDIADMKNVGSGRGAGSTTAAQFLQRFVGNTKWAHLDIAGVAWKGKGDSVAAKGATGYGVRLLDELVRMYEEK
jgi:leucyl aminopeptidase